jgi:hypothetical protein
MLYWVFCACLMCSFRVRRCTTVQTLLLVLVLWHTESREAIRRAAWVFCGVSLCCGYGILAEGSRLPGVWWS